MLSCLDDSCLRLNGMGGYMLWISGPDNVIVLAPSRNAGTP